MANETTITVVGRLTDVPEIRFTPNGVPVASFSVASNARRFNKQTNEWEDEPATFWACELWRDQAERAATLAKGTHVAVIANVKTHSWQDKQTGQDRSRIVLEVQEMGPLLRFQEVTARKTGQPTQNTSQPASTGGEWGAPATGAGGWGGTPDAANPPF